MKHGMELLRSKRGSLIKVARALGKSKSAISQWKKVPGELVVEVEKATNIPRELLRPDLHRPRPKCVCGGDTQEV
jgi:DNA-binding transcriptional regulator YdaS (Cro superfamily)